MEKHLFILVLFVLAFIALIIFVIIKNHKDRKNLFKKLPGDSADPKYVRPEFDAED
jgi:FtsZ-interacting cell division protein ZipA